LGHGECHREQPGTAGDSGLGQSAVAKSKRRADTAGCE